MDKKKKPDFCKSKLVCFGVAMPDCRYCEHNDEFVKEATHWAKDNIVSIQGDITEDDLINLKKKFMVSKMDAIPCIKRIRAITNLGLCESKKMYDNWKDEKANTIKIKKE